MCRGMRWLSKELGIDAHTPMDELKETRKNLKKNVKTYTKKASEEVKKAEEFRRAGDCWAANLCLEMKRLFDRQIRRLEYFQFLIRKQILELQAAKATVKTAVALENGRATVQQVQEATNIDEVTANLGQYQDSSPTPSGAATGFDEDEPGTELEEREGADPVPQRTV